MKSNLITICLRYLQVENEIVFSIFLQIKYLSTINQFENYDTENPMEFYAGNAELDVIEVFREKCLL